MSRRYADPVEVRRRNDLPAEFLWRGRLYIVREILDYWVEAGSWWRSPAAQALFTAGLPPSADRPPALEHVRGRSEEPDPSTGSSAGKPAPATVSGQLDGPVEDIVDEDSGDPDSWRGPRGVDDGEREIWRVEAGAGRDAGSGIYDLSFNWSAGSWALIRAHD